MSLIGQEEGIVHGTLKGYRQHRRRQVDPCESCRQAVREDDAKKHAARKTSPKVRTPEQAAWYGGKFRNTTPPVVPNLERAASLTVAAWSKDAAECRELLAMLDLPSGGES
ncbi:hypothetical protein [Streptosporangium sp. NPDC006930]|uniref:hypothetical protein n=1 Tax=Streptosporangium sp. NPDC006930 TaxID=3154783 RepID=UPI00341CADEE